MKRHTTPTYCCAMMTENLTNKCDTHKNRDECPDALLSVYSKGEIGLMIHDGSDSYIQINHCPWCGLLIKPREKLVDVTIDIDDTTWVLLAKEAHAKNITINEVVVQILQDYIDSKEAKPKKAKKKR